MMYSVSDDEMARTYDFEKVIAHGNETKIMAGHDTRSRRPVALKMIPRNKKWTVDNVLHELRMHRLCIHPHIVPVIGGYQTSRYFIVVTQLVEGGDLHDAVHYLDDPLTESMLIRIFAQLASALRHMHDRGLAHNDVKPENVLLDRGRNASLCDFGLASFADVRPSSGTPSYMAPEVAAYLLNKMDSRSSEGCDENTLDLRAADVWSFGATLFYMLTAGRVPWPTVSHDGEGTLRAIVNAASRGIVISDDRIPPLAAELLRAIFVETPASRITMAGVMAHPWFENRPDAVSPEKVHQ